MVRTCFLGPVNPGPSEEVMDALGYLHQRHFNETPEMWCSRIRIPFKKILKENPKYFTENEYIQMAGLMYSDGKVSGIKTNYIYCTVCDSLVFLPDAWGYGYADEHLKRCIAGNTVSNEYANREELLKMIARKEESLWSSMRGALTFEAEIRRIELELSPQSQSLSHSEKDRQASASYDYYNIRYADYKASLPFQQDAPALTEHSTLEVPKAGAKELEVNSTQLNYTNLGTLAAYFKSMQKNTIYR
jgi:hypothetical protein